MAYHYVDSGLDNVWLENGYTLHTTPYGEGVSIQNTAGLHHAIGRWVISLPKPLNGAEVRFLRLEMELTQRDLAGILGTEEQAVRRWEKARTKPVANGPADRLLRALYEEFLDGDGSVRRMVDRLAQLNQIDPQSVSFCETSEGWQPNAPCAA
ncbi:helix-turn-helix domain-containing protein [Brucella pseudogrignonensis]|uniref:helix-turn-helix domain-containing protein n=1 Tax=Brucella pseudogrignonensis TaxID=419475 RepID=UPI0015C69397|nr:transcriptional regulator [Brucella pseudogrignonensis]